MKFATVLLAGILMMGSFASMKGADPAGSSQVALGFTGGSVWTSSSTGICIWYLPIVGDLEPGFLFTGPMGTPIIDREHAYFIWVSDFTAQGVPPNKNFNFLALIPAGEGTIYFTTRPDLRDWSDLTNRSTWGEAVAKFGRKAGLYQSIDKGASGTFIFSADLISSTVITVYGKTVNFKNLVPYGMTCFEAGVGEAEAGTCLASGAKF